MANFAAVAGEADERPAVDDQAAADTDLAGDEQDVIGPDRRTATLLGQRAEIRLVGDRDRQVYLQPADQPLAQGDVVPAEVGSHPYEAVTAPDDPNDRDPDAGQRVAHSRLRANEARQLHQVIDRFVDRDFQGEDGRARRVGTNHG